MAPPSTASTAVTTCHDFFFIEPQASRVTRIAAEQSAMDGMDYPIVSHYLEKSQVEDSYLALSLKYCTMTAHI